MGTYNYVRTVTEDMVSGYDADAVGEQKITITYAGQTAEYTVTVYEAPEGEDSANSGGDGGSGCGSAVFGGGIALIALCGGLIAFRRRKKD